MPRTSDVISLKTENRGDARRLVVTRDKMRVSVLLIPSYRCPLSASGSKATLPWILRYAFILQPPEP